MTAWEQIKRQFEAGAVCRYKQTPRLHYEPGCMWIECDRGDDCKCRMNNGDTKVVTPFLAEWHARRTEAATNSTRRSPSRAASFAPCEAPTPRQARPSRALTT